MQTTALYLLSLVGGYAIATTWQISRFYAARESGHRLYFRATFYAVFAVACTFLIHVYFFSSDKTGNAYQNIIRWIGIVLYDDHSTVESLKIFEERSKGTVLLATLPCSILIANLLNLPKLLVNMSLPGTENYRPFYEYQKLILNWAISNNDFEKLLARAAERTIPILFTLDTGKIYVGWMVRAPNPIEERKAVRILPLLSGFRDPKTQVANFVTTYFDVLDEVQEGNELDHLEVGDFEIVFPADRIISSHMFDLVTYVNFYEKDDVVVTESIMEIIARGMIAEDPDQLDHT